MTDVLIWQKHEGILKWENMNQIGILKNVKRNALSHTWDYGKSPVRKATQKLLLFYKQRKAEARGRQRDSPPALHSMSLVRKWNRVLTQEPTGNCQTSPSLPCFPARNLKGHRLLVGGISPSCDSLVPCCLEPRPWAAGSAGSRTVSMSEGGRETWQPASLAFVGEGEESWGLRNHWKKKSGWRKTKRQGPTWRGSGVANRK